MSEKKKFLYTYQMKTKPLDLLILDLFIGTKSSVNEKLNDYKMQDFLLQNFRVKLIKANE